MRRVLTGAILAGVSGCTIPGAGWVEEGVGTPLPITEPPEGGESVDTGRFGVDDTATPSPSGNDVPDAPESPEPSEPPPAEPLPPDGPAASCTEADAMPPLMTGTYLGALDGFPHASVQMPCTEFPTYGERAYFRVLLQPGQRVDVAWQSKHVDGQLFLLDACGVASSCLIGADEAPTGEPETLSYVHQDPTVGELYLMLAHYASPVQASPYQVDVMVR